MSADATATATAERVAEARSFTHIAREIEGEIRNGALVCGQKLPTERELATRFGVSRGVVREAIKALEAMGLVESRQGSGIYVCDRLIASISRALTLSVQSDTASVLDLFVFREPLEVLAAECAAHNRTDADLAALAQWVAAGDRAAVADDYPAFRLADEAFHTAVSVASGNDYVRAVIGAVLHMRHIVVALTDPQFGSVHDGARTHAAIAAAIAARAPEAAGVAMRDDVHGYADALRAILAETRASADADTDEGRGAT